MNQISSKLSTTFHRTFSLSRPSLNQIMSLAGETTTPAPDGKCISNNQIRESTSLGSIYVEAMPRYGRGAGLLTDGNCLTEFGKCVFAYDPMLEGINTQWLIHYHLCAPHGYGPAFWNEVCTTQFRSGNRFRQNDVAGQIYDFANKQVTSISLKSAKATATIFCGTYTKADGLASLRILEKNKEDFYVLVPDSPPAWVFAYALMDHWAANYPDRLSINLDELTGERGLANLFLMDKGTVNRTLNQLQQAGVVEVYRSAQPYQLLLLSQDTSLALQKIYEYA